MNRKTIFASTLFALLAASGASADAQDIPVHTDPSLKDLHTLQPGQSYVLKPGRDESQKGYLPCSQGPIVLNTIDEAERANKWNGAFVDGKRMPTEIVAELYIADCSDALAKLSLELATIYPNADKEIVKGAVTFWQQNLDYMKGWLANRQEKARR
jgi:hypothetical protein